MKICFQIITTEPVIVQAGPELILSVAKFSGDAVFFSIFLGVLLEKKFSTIGTALPIIAQTRSSAYSLR